MMKNRTRLFSAGAVFLAGLIAGCGKGSTAEPAPSAATRPEPTAPAPQAPTSAASQPGVLLVECNPGGLQRALPELTEAFNVLPAGGTLKAELYGDFPVGEIGEFMLVGELEIEAGTVAVKAPNRRDVSEILYGSGGSILFPYEVIGKSFRVVGYPCETIGGIKRLKLREGNILPTEKLAMVGVSLHKGWAYIDFGTLKMADDTPLPEEFRAGYRYCTYLSSGSTGYLLEMRKSPDFRGKAVRFTVTRSL